MTAKDVYKIVKVLSYREERKLLDIIVNGMEDKITLKKIKKINRKPLITEQEADEYIYKHVFCKVK